MKKISFLMLTVLVGVLSFSLAIPGHVKATTIGERFDNNSYMGTWELTDYPCSPEKVGNTGEIILWGLSVKDNGILKSDSGIWFDDTFLYMSGRIYKKNDKFRIRVTYPTEDTGFDGVLKGRITQKKIRGTYTHTANGCTWKGSFIAPRYY